MKKIIKFFVLVMAVIILVEVTMVLWLPPIKKAIKFEDIEKSKSYIIVKTARVTGSDWIVVDSNNTYFDVEKYIRIEGVEPDGYNFGIEYGNNSFVCYGEYIKKDYSDDTGTYDIFKSNSWDILYPIQRNSLLGFLMPKSYLSKYDLK